MSPVIVTAANLIIDMLIYKPLMLTVWDTQVVAWLRQPNIIDILSERQASLRGSGGAVLREKVALVRKEGTPALNRLSHDMHLTILLR